MTNKRISKRKRVGRHSDKVRQACAVDYAVTGSMADTSIANNVPERTICGWLQDGVLDTWIAEVRASNSERAISQYDRLVHKALKLAEQGIDNLDGTTLKANDIKALVISSAASSDKSRLLQNIAAPSSDKQTSMDDMVSLFNAISDSYDKRRRIVSEQ